MKADHLYISRKVWVQVHNLVAHQK